MMTSRQHEIDRIVSDQGWDETSRLGIMLDFIHEVEYFKGIDVDGALIDYLTKRAAKENEKK